MKTYNRLVPALVRSALRRPGSRMTVAAFPCGPAFDALLYESPHDFVVVTPPGQKLPPLPPNAVAVGIDRLPPDLDADLVVCPHEEAAFRNARELSPLFHAPLVCVWLRPPDPAWAATRLEYARSCRGDVNLFPARELADTWGVPGVVAAHPAPVLDAAGRQVYVWGSP